MFADTDTERAGIEERYETACNASSLKVEAEKGGAGDILVAAGWTESAIGMSMLRLRSQWDRAEKPQRNDEAKIKALAEANLDERGKPRLTWARSESVAWYRKQLRELAVKLTEKAGLLEKLTHWAILRGIDPMVVGPAVLYWLSPICTVCDGHGRRKVKDAPVLSAKQCHACNGTGNAHQPEGAGRVLSHIDYVVQVARQSIKRRLRP